MTHTPTPWVVTPGLNRGGVTIRAEAEKDGDIRKPVAEIWHNGDDPEETAAFIVKAVNSHDALVEALAWYGEQARLARLIHSEGDAGRHALAGDGGKRAREALAALETPANPIEEVVNATRQD